MSVWDPRHCLPTYLYLRRYVNIQQLSNLEMMGGFLETFILFITYRLDTITGAT